MMKVSMLRNRSAAMPGNDHFQGYWVDPIVGDFTVPYQTDSAFHVDLTP
jgi:hypothetical protein